MKHYLKKNARLLFAAMLTLSACSGHSSKTTTGETVPETRTETVAGTKALHLEDLTATWIQDNPGDKLMPRSLFSDAPDSIIEKLHLQEGIPSSVSTFLVETKGLRILFDTGLGYPAGQLTNKLKDLKIRPDEIRYIYLTHLHGDHIGGLLKGDSVVFPKAEVYISSAEYKAWETMPDKANAQFAQMVKHYKERIRLFEFGDTLPGNVMTIDAGGHTPGHTAFQVGKLLIVGDLMHGAALQTAYPEYCANYDMDKDKARDTRIRILQYARENKLVMAGMHLPAPAFLPQQ